MSNPQRYAATVAGLGAFAVMAILGMHECTAGLYARVLHAWGIEPFAFPFLDFAGYLSSLNCTRLGVDVIADNPCDPLKRQFNYGPLWLDLTFLPLYPEHRLAGGTILALLFLASLSCLPPPRRGWQVVTTVLASLSSMVVFAVERGNPDILIFLLTVVVVNFARRGGVTRGVGYGLAWFAAGLKFYPAALLTLAMRERPARSLLVAMLSALLLGLYLLRYHQDLARILPQLPDGGYDGDMFAAKNLPMRLGLVTRAALAPSGWATAWGVVAGGGVAALLMLRGVRTIRRLLRDARFATAMAVLDEATWHSLLCGAVLIVFCFLAWQNIAYRGIFFLLALPGLSALRDVPLCRRLVPAVLFVMWEGAARHALTDGIAAAELDAGTAFLLQLAYWLFRELVWWWIASVLLAIILWFLWQSPMRSALWPRGD